MKDKLVLRYPCQSQSVLLIPTYVIIIIANIVIYRNYLVNESYIGIRKLISDEFIIIRC